MKNIHKDYKGEYHVYYMWSDNDTPDKYKYASILSALSKCGLIDCKNYKTCDLKQIKSNNVQCINYKHPLK